jgi:predicted transcriptional regulator
MTTQMLVRIDPELKTKVNRLAKADCKSMSIEDGGKDDKTI